MTVSWWFTDRRTGSITVNQPPNLALQVAGTAQVASVLLRRHPRRTGTITAAAVSRGALVLWALDEIVRGVNPWRRLLGTVALVWAVASVPPVRQDER